MGGAAFGLGTGWIAYRLRKSVDDYHVEILLTLALVSGGYARALSFPPRRSRELVLAVTYVLGFLSILVQGPTLPRLIRRVSTD